jgi:hypothetical protein
MATENIPFEMRHLSGLQRIGLRPNRIVRETFKEGDYLVISPSALPTVGEKDLPKVIAYMDYDGIGKFFYPESDATIGVRVLLDLYPEE